MKDKIIIMPNGDGVLASTITAVSHVPLGDGLPHAVATVSLCGGRIHIARFDDDKTAVAERDRILAEWQAWLEGPAGERVDVLHPPYRALSAKQIMATAHQLAAKLCVAGTDDNRKVVADMVMDELDGLRFDERNMALCGRADKPEAGERVELEALTASTPEPEMTIAQIEVWLIAAGCEVKSRTGVVARGWGLTDAVDRSKFDVDVDAYEVRGYFVCWTDESEPIEKTLRSIEKVLGRRPTIEDTER